MGRGRRPKPPELKVLQGNWRQDRDPVDAPTAPRGRPAPANEELGAEGRQKWTELCDQLETMKVLVMPDREILWVACNAWEEIQAARRLIKRHGRMIVGAKGGWIASPAVAMLREARAAYQRALVEMGLTGAARSKVRVRPGDENQDAFDWARRGLAGDT